MQWYAVFYDKWKHDGLVSYMTSRKASGALLRIDGRLKYHKAMTRALEHGRKRQYDCFSLQRVDSLRECNREDNPLINLYKI